MSFIESIKTVLSKYMDFKGRARRSEYWWWTLAVGIVSWVLFYALGVASWEKAVINGDTATTGAGFALYSLFSLAIFLPGLGVLIRRLHDLDKSGWSWLIALIPLVGVILLIVWLATEGTRGVNKYGPDPKAA